MSGISKLSDFKRPQEERWPSFLRRFRQVFIAARQVLIFAGNWKNGLIPKYSFTKTFN